MRFGIRTFFVVFVIVAVVGLIAKIKIEGDLLEARKKALLKRIQWDAWVDYEQQLRPSSIEDLGNVESVVISCSDFDMDELTLLPALRELRLKNVDDQKLMAVGQLKQLEKLDLRNNKIKTIPSSIRNLTKLKELNLQNSDGVNIAHLRSLKSLEVLNLEFTKVNNFFPLANCKQLRKLKLFRNKVEDSRFLGELENLRELTVIRSELGDISPLAKLTKLESLSIIDSEIIELSPINKLKQLRRLDLHDVKLQENNALRLIGFSKLEYLNTSDINGDAKIKSARQRIEFNKALLTTRRSNVTISQMELVLAKKKLRGLPEIEVRNCPKLDRGNRYRNGVDGYIIPGHDAEE